MIYFFSMGFSNDYCTFHLGFAFYQGGTTGERFVTSLKETLLPTLHSGDIVVMGIFCICMGVLLVAIG